MKENIEDLKVIQNLNLKLIIYRRIPDNPLPTQCAGVPVSRLTGFLYVLFLKFFISFINHSLLHTKSKLRMPL